MSEGFLGTPCLKTIYSLFSRSIIIDSGLHKATYALLKIKVHCLGTHYTKMNDQKVEKTRKVNATITKQ